MTGFVIYYSDGAVVSGRTPEDWAAAPAEGVLVVVEVHAGTYLKRGVRRHGVTRHAQQDYYALLPDGSIWSGAGKHLPGEGDVKTGAWTDDGNYLAIYNSTFPDPSEEAWPS